MGTTQTKMDKHGILRHLAFHTHSPPDISDGDYILAILNVPFHFAGSDAMAYHVSDFFIFEALISQTPSIKQKWMCLAEPADMVAYNGIAAYEIGCLEGKSPLRSIDGSDKSSVVCIPDPHQMLAELVFEIRAMAKAAEEEQKVLTVMAFGPTTYEQDIILDLDKPVILARETIARAMQPTQRATLFTPALFSSGWLVCPFIADYPCFIEMSKIEIMAAKLAGGALAQACLDTVKRGGSPLLTELSTSEIGEKRDPYSTSMTERARELGGFFHQCVLTILRSGFAVHPKKHALNLYESKDEWTKVLGGRRQRLEVFKARAELIPRRIDPSKTEPRNHFDFLGEAFGGCRVSQVNHLKILVQSFLATSLLDQELSEEMKACKYFREFLKKPSHLVDEELAYDIFSRVEYRFSKLWTATIIVDLLQLPRPMGQRCSQASTKRYEDSFAPMNDRLRLSRISAFGGIANIFPPMTVGFDRDNPQIKRAEKGLNFWRPEYYIALAIALESHDIESIASTVRKLISKLHELLVAEACEVPALRSVADAWFRSMGFKTVVNPGKPLDVENTQQTRKLLKKQQMTTDTAGLKDSIWAPQGQAVDRSTCASIFPPDGFNYSTGQGNYMGPAGWLSLGGFGNHPAQSEFNRLSGCDFGHQLGLAGHPCPVVQLGHPGRPSAVVQSYFDDQPVSSNASQVKMHAFLEQTKRYNVEAQGEDGQGSVVEMKRPESTSVAFIPTVRSDGDHSSWPR